MRRIALILSIIAVPLFVFAAPSEVNTGATSSGTVGYWEPGGAVTVLPDTATAGRAKRLKGRKSIVLQWPHSGAGACCVTFEPTAPVTTTTGCNTGLALYADQPVLARNYGDTFPVKIACTIATSRTAGTAIQVDQAK